jgi:hypothetical protein
MKHVLLNSVMILAAIWFTGCTVVVHEQKRHPHEPHVSRVPADGTIEEIRVDGAYLEFVL